MTDDRAQCALAILAAIGTGVVPLAPFTPDAHWWWNGGLDLPVADFAALIADLHAKTESGITIATGLVLAQDDHLMVEATSAARLPNGRTYDNRYIFLFRFAGDAIRGVREYSDSAHVNAVFDIGS